MKNTLLIVLSIVLLEGCGNSSVQETANSTAGKDSIGANDNKVPNYKTDPRIEAHTKTFLKKLNSDGGKPIEQLSPADARKVLEGAQSSVPVDVSGVDIIEKYITQDSINVKIYILRPSSQKGVVPVFMFFHGGGWVLGDFATHKRLVRDLVFYSGMACVFVEYARSPEAKYPLALNQCYAATKWVAEHGAEINVDGKHLAIAGNSVGGNLTAATALMAKDKGGPAIKFQLLLWPVTNASFETVSYQQNATSRFLTKNMMIWFWDSYMPKDDHREDIYASPLQAHADQLKGLPPALIQTAENDVLRDEGEAYAIKMDEAGVSVTRVRIGGMIHDYGLLNPLANTPAVQTALRFAAGELKFALK